VTRVFPLSLVSETDGPVPGVQIQVLSNLSDTSSVVWSGTTDNNGYAEPNITFNSTNYRATFYLYLPLLGGQSAPLTLLANTPVNWSARATGPFAILHATQGNITKGSFGYNATVSNDTMNVTVTITNATTTWSNLSWNNTQLASLGWSLSQTYDGMLLPAGNWTMTVTLTNESGATNTTTTLLQSLPQSERRSQGTHRRPRPSAVRTSHSSST